MKKILVIVAHYSPDPSSVANCMQPLLHELSKSYSVDILTNRKCLEDTAYEKGNNLTIYRIENLRLMAVNKLNDLKKINFTPLTKLFTRLFIVALKTICSPGNRVPEVGLQEEFLRNTKNSIIRTPTIWSFQRPCLFKVTSLRKKLKKAEVILSFGTLSNLTPMPIMTASLSVVPDVEK
jgi:hypothetical protein